MSKSLPRNYKPSDIESFMNPKQQEYFRQKLIQWRDELLAESNLTIQNLQEGSSQSPDVADRASMETDRTVELDRPEAWIDEHCVRPPKKEDVTPATLWT